LDTYIRQGVTRSSATAETARIYIALPYSAKGTLIC